MVPLDNRTRSLSKQFSGFLPSRSHSSNLFADKMIQYPIPLFLSFLLKYGRPKLPKVMYMYDASL